uniref:AzlC family ABC transporter permease n=1 Tax=Pararhizobium sp. IMCC3301 TaxID=3067904 RepID=UPI002741C817|nr:AzlC family ABC transporter permease [Pararhizobium sp. IMCC3301]
MTAGELQINERREFTDGAKAALPVIAAVVPFGAVYGAAAVSKGLTLFETMFMSSTVFAGASQMVAIDLLATPLPFWTIVLSVFAVNFRHILYSASLGRKMHRFGPLNKALAFLLLVDPQWAVSEKRALSQPLTPWFYFGLALPLYISWLLASGLGAAFGKLVTNPQVIALDFILPIYFIAILMSFRQRYGWLSVVLVSGLAALLAYWTVGPPWHVASGAFAGILYAAWRGKPKELLALTPGKARNV